MDGLFGIPGGYKGDTVQEYNLAKITCCMYRTTNQSITGSQVLSFDAILFDSGSMIDLAAQPTRITFRTAGIYAVWAHMGWAANATGQRVIRYQVNGGSQSIIDKQPNNGASEPRYIQAFAINTFKVGDYIEAFAAQDSGGALNSVADGTGAFKQPCFGATKLG